MRRKRDGPRAANGLLLGHDEVAAVGLLSPQAALSGPPLDCAQASLLDHIREAIENLVPWHSSSWRGERRPVSARVPHPEHLDATCPSPVLGQGEPHARLDRPQLEAPWIPSAALPDARSDRGEWQRLQRFVALSGLGWAFVLSGLSWEIFALTFSRCVGWGWDKGAFFFAWGLGIIAFGFYQRASRQRPAVSRLFLGVNVFMLGVLSLVVGTR